MSEVYVREDGCIRLGSNVACDGFISDVALRIQTHAHHDHLRDFERSKGIQEIVLSTPTLDLLIAEFNADLPHRSNIHSIPLDGNYHEISKHKIALYPSGHMIGSAIACVKDDDLGELVYTGDFSWPLINLPKHPEYLVIDAQYGDPKLIRNYDRNEVKNKFLDLVRDELGNGIVVFTGHRGRLQHAAQMVSEQIHCPFIFTTNASKTLDVFMQYRGFQVDKYNFISAEAKKLIRSNERCCIFAEFRDRTEIDQIRTDKRIYLSPYMVPREDPIKTISNRIRVALTDHADFNETINLVKAISPQNVICDNSRGGNADALAQYIREELGIPSQSECKEKTANWGG